MYPAWRALLQNIELMPQDQDFSFEPLARLEQLPSMRTKRKAIAIIDRDHVLIGQGRYPGGWRFRKRQPVRTSSMRSRSPVMRPIVTARTVSTFWRIVVS